MPATTCPSAEQLEAYAVGRLSDDASDVIAEHLDTCIPVRRSPATLDNAEDTLVSRLPHAQVVDPVVAEPQCDARRRGPARSRREQMTPLSQIVAPLAAPVRNWVSTGCSRNSAAAASAECTRCWRRSSIGLWP